MEKGKIITFIIGILAFSITIKLYFTPPTDYDGGPMLAYNLFFFYPLLLLSIFLSIVVIFRLKYFKKDIRSKLLLIISIVPSLIFLLIFLRNIVQIANEPEILDLDIPNNSINLNVNDSLKVNLHGFTKRTLDINEEIITLKIINIVPYINGIYSFKDGGKFTSKSENHQLFYKIENDSLILYNQEYEFSFFNSTRLSLAFNVKNIEPEKIKIKQLEEMGFKNFNWK